MRKIIYYILILASTLVHGQNSKRFKQFDSSVQNVKETTTVFIFNEQYSINEYKNMLTDTWTVTPFEVIYNKDFDIMTYVDKKYSIVSIGSFYSTSTFEDRNLNRISTSGINYFYTCSYLDLNQVPNTEVEANIYKYYSRDVGSFLLSPSLSFEVKYSNNSDQIKNLRKNNAFTLNETLYKPNIFTNYDLYSLKMHFKELNFMIENNTKRIHKEGVSLIKKKSKKSIESLVTDTLYIPNDIPEKNYQKYKYPYKVVSKKELERVVLSNKSIKYVSPFMDDHIAAQENVTRIIDSNTGLPILTIRGPSWTSYSKLFAQINNKVSRLNR